MGARRWSFPTTGCSISMADAAAAVEATERVFAALAHPSRRHILLTDDSYMDQGIPILRPGRTPTDCSQRSPQRRSGAC